MADPVEVSVEAPAVPDTGADLALSDIGDGGEGESAGDLFDQILNGTAPPDEGSAEDEPDVPDNEGDEGEKEKTEPAVGKKYEFESADGTKKMMTLAEAQKAFKAGGMMQADYTKKTQELKAEQRKLSTEIAELRANESRLVSTARNIKAFIADLADPNLDSYRFIKMLEQKGAPMKKHLGALLRDLDNERNMPEEQRAEIDRARRQRVAQQEIAAEERRVEQVRQARLREEREYAQKKANDTMSAWTAAAFKEAEIEGSDVEVERLRARLRTVANTERRRLTYDDFVEAANHVKNSVVDEIRKRKVSDLVTNLTPEQLREINLHASKRLKELNGAPAGAARGNKPAAKPARGPRTLDERLRDGA